MNDTKNTGFWHSAREWAKVIVIALVIALPVRFYIAEPFVVNGPSMDPTFSSGQFLIVDRLSYHWVAPARGDVVVFRYPHDPRVYYIKRIIGLPGETVEIADGRVSIVGQSGASGAAAQPIAEPYVESVHESHDTVTEKVLGPTEYFVMGDNRAQSSDSRAWGPLDQSFIIGRPVIRLSPLNSIGIFPGQYHEDQA